LAEPVNEFVITPHAVFEMRRRQIEESALRGVLAAPEQRYAVRSGRDVLQSRITIARRTYLLRVFVDIDRQPAEVVTVYPGCEVFEDKSVRATYDASTDTLSIILKADAVIAESDEDKPGVILDYDGDGNLVSLEILDASTRVTEARRFEFETIEP